jgi:hypothetical protein
VGRVREGWNRDYTFQEAVSFLEDIHTVASATGNEKSVQSV